MKDTAQNIKILVTDDETLARKRVVKFIGESDLSVEIFEASNGKEAIEALTKIQPDLLFLDIKMTDMTGFDVLHKVPKKQIPIVIFVTAFDAFAVKAFEVQAIDFLLKPFKKQRFIEALKRGVAQLELTKREHFQAKVARLIETFSEGKLKETDTNGSYLDAVVLKKNRAYYFIKTNTILYIKSSGYYAEIYTHKNEKHVHRISMSRFIEQLNPKDFSRINRSTIVALKNIKKVVSEGMGDYSLIMKDGTTFSVSKGFKEDLLHKMGIR